MRTTLNLDDGLMGALMEHLPDKSKTEAVEHAIREYLARESASRLIELAGKLDIEDVSKELRSVDRKTL